jgi:hypothetical protein
MKISERFKKGYYINLDRRTDRKANFEKEMENAGLKNFFERVSAEDGINEKDAILRHCYCASTYFKLFKKVYEEGDEEVLIFEDDAFFYNGGKENGLDIAEKALTQLSENKPEWDIFYFGGLPTSPIKPISKNLGYCDSVLATHAAVYKRSLIKRVLEQYKPFLDAAIDGWYAGKKDIKKIIITPLAVPQREGVSDLDAWGRSVGPGGYLADYKKQGGL